jgi:hypothetical protein
MSSAEDPEEIRRALIEALEQNKWHFTNRAHWEGLDAFRDLEENPSKEAMIDYILELLEAGFPGRCVELHDDPRGTAFEMVNSYRRADGRGLYIKLKLDWPYAIVISFHYSDRP